MSMFSVQSSYSPAATAVMETFCDDSSRTKTREEYEANGHIYTNELGYHMGLVETHEAGHEDVTSAIQYSNLSSRAITFLGQVRKSTPDLWQRALATRAYTKALHERSQSEVREHGAVTDNTETLLTAAIPQERTLMTQVFNAIPFTDNDADIEVALELCGSQAILHQ